MKARTSIDPGQQHWPLYLHTPDANKYLLGEGRREGERKKGKRKAKTRIQ